MWRNYIKVAFRNLLKNGFYSFINIFGLAIGLACCILIMLFVRNELSYDSFHTKADRLYRVVEDQHYANGNIFSVEATPGPLAPALISEIPQVENASRISWDLQQNLFSEGQAYKSRGRYVDASFLQMFSIPLISGNVDKALHDVSSIVISENLARILFNTTEVVGKTLSVENTDEVRITGVFKDLPANSSMRFDFLLPYELFRKNNAWLDNWGSNGIRTFVLLHENAEPEQAKAAMKNFLRDRDAQDNVDLYIQPLRDIRLYSEFKQGQNVGGRIILVQLFSGIAIFMILIACINFMNLSTARSARRSREVGVRKAIGAYREQLMFQFLSESFLVSVFAGLLAIVIAELSLPLFNSISGIPLHIPYMDGVFIGLFTLLILVTAVLAGSYPAFMLSSFNPIQVLKGRLSPGRSSTLFRKGLVVFQFFISIVLIVGTLVIGRQIHYMKNKDLGLNLEHVLMLEINSELKEHFAAFQTELMQNSAVVGVSGTSQSPLSIGSNSSSVKWPGKNENDQILFQQLYTDAYFVPSFDLKLIEGRNFSASSKADTANFIINQTAARLMALENPVGTEIEAFGRKGQVIGVAQDFHTNSVRNSMDPCIILMEPAYSNVAFIKLTDAPTAATLDQLKAAFETYSPSFPFSHTLLKDNYQEAYKTETLVGKLTSWFSVLTILISCLGLFGLAAFSTEQRRKEIGVRKVMGASATELVLMLSGSFTKWVGLAFLLAAPISYWLMEMVLRNFAYRVDVGVFTLLQAGGIAFILAIITVGYLSFKAAQQDPAFTLKED